MQTLVTGATGFVGHQLVQQLPGAVRILSRNPESAARRLAGLDVTPFRWDPEKQPAPVEAFNGVDAVFHLAGESVADGRWTKAKKQRLQDSRILGTRNLVETIKSLANPPRVLVAASAVGYYGDRGEQELVETEEPGDDFLSDLCVSWEQEAREAETIGMRVVRLRIGIVLGAGGGALKKMLPIFRMGLGSPLGSGRQWMPWIHQADLVALMIHAAEHSELQGPVNATAPSPVTNREFTKTLAKTLHRPAFFPAVPRLVLRATLGEFADALLGSQRVVPKAAAQSGFEFRFPYLSDALKDLLA